MLVIFFTYWAGMFLQGAESNVSVDIDILQWVVVVPNAMFVVVIVVIALRGASISKVPWLISQPVMSHRQASISKVSCHTCHVEASISKVP